jgi:pteridine reductase
MKTLKGKTALVTGGAKRVGRELVLALAGAGVNTVIHYCASEKEAHELAGEVVGQGVSAWCVQCDFSKAEHLQGFVEHVLKQCQVLHFLINSASDFAKADFSDLTQRQFAAALELEAWTPFALGRAFAQDQALEQVVNMLDAKVISGVDYAHLGYHAGKKLLENLTEIMALQFAPRVAVNALALGAIMPPSGADSKYVEKLVDSLPLKRMGSPQYVAEALIYLLSSEYLTGQTIFVDGGEHLVSSF